MLLCEWKVKGEIASVFIIDYRPKGWISARIAGRFVTGRSQHNPHPSQDTGSMITATIRHLAGLMMLLQTGLFGSAGTIAPVPLTCQ